MVQKNSGRIRQRDMMESLGGYLKQMAWEALSEVVTLELRTLKTTSLPVKLEGQSLLDRGKGSCKGPGVGV